MLVAPDSRGHTMCHYRAFTITLALLGAVIAACGGEPEGDVAAAPPPPPAIRPGESVQDSLATSDTLAGRSHQDTWSLELTAGQRIRIELRSPDFIALARLLGPTGDIITSNDDSLGRGATITYRAAASGPHRILVRSADSAGAVGAYTLAVEAMDESTAGPGAPAMLAIGDSITGVLEVGDSLSRREGANNDTGLLDIIELRPGSAGVVAVTVTSPHFDAFLAFGDSATYRSMVPRAGPSADPARIVFRADSGVPYRLGVVSHGADRPNGQYHLVARATRERPIPFDTMWGRMGTLPPLLRSVCAGGAATGAAPYDAAAQAIHPTAVTLANGHGATSVPEWAPARRRPVELVLCLVRSRVVLQVCHYNGPDITRFRNRWTASLREAATGRLVHQASVTGDSPRTCNYNEAYSLTELSGSLVSSDDAFSAIRSQFARLINPADTTAPLPARAPARRPPRNPGGKAPTR